MERDGRRRIHCDFCGTGDDGKPPKRIVEEKAGNDKEANEPGWLGRLLGPITYQSRRAGFYVHEQCAVWSPEVYFAGPRRLKNVKAEFHRGRGLKCSRCGRRGATLGCRVEQCPKTYHLPCAHANGCIFFHRDFLIACPDHKHGFQPQGNIYFDMSKKQQVKKMNNEKRKTSNDEWSKDVEEVKTCLENCGHVEGFLKRERKKLCQDMLSIAPTYIGGSSCKQEMQFEGWESVAGLQSVIQCMKEVVILPLLYSDFFDNLGIAPPKGVLLHGYPGTGKTLVVRALIGECTRSDKRIAYFSLKGADCLGKYVGDAERQLRLLFQAAEKSQPSIIFFDEIDGLAPCRTQQQGQTHNSIVTTLLALMDGLKSRGSVVVIGATNRPDAVDPGLRRPGRFDREIYFPLPSVSDREAILSLHTRKFSIPIVHPLLKCIAEKTRGFSGADLHALCTEAAMIALRRRFSLQELLSSLAGRTFSGELPPLPKVIVEERDWLEAISSARTTVSSEREAGKTSSYSATFPLHASLVHCLLQPAYKLLIALYHDDRVWLPPQLCQASKLIENVIHSALDEKKLKRDNWCDRSHDLLSEENIKSKVEEQLRIAGVLIGGSCFNSTFSPEGDSSHGNSKLESSRMQCTRSGLSANRFRTSREKSAFCILISGNPRSGQRHIASCLLHYFVCDFEVQKVDLATISQEGFGDMLQGLTQIFKRCATLGSCMIFMPKLDTWAIEISDEGHPSSLWNLFVGQVDSLSGRISLMILATSDTQFSNLPSRIRHFFKAERSQSNLSTPIRNTLPQFLVEVDGRYDSFVVLHSCAAKLSEDLAQHFVQILHYRGHTNNNSFNNPRVIDVSNVEGVGQEQESEQCMPKNTDGHNVDCNCPSSTGGLPPSGITCSYRCCSFCLVKLRDSVKEILSRELANIGNDPKVEDVYDAVSCVSSKLHTSVRRLSLTRNLSNSSCRGRYSESAPKAMECHRHSSNHRVRGTVTSGSESGLRFTIRDGVLTTSGTHCGIPFHCDLETLCLCSLTEIIGVNEQFVCC